MYELPSFRNFLFGSLGRPGVVRNGTRWSSQTRGLRPCREPRGSVPSWVGSVSNPVVRSPTFAIWNRHRCTAIETSTYVTYWTPRYYRRWIYNFLRSLSDPWVRFLTGSLPRWCRYSGRRLEISTVSHCGWTVSTSMF